MQQFINEYIQKRFKIFFNYSPTKYYYKSDLFCQI